MKNKAILKPNADRVEDTIIEKNKLLLNSSDLKKIFIEDGYIVKEAEARDWIITPGQYSAIYSIVEQSPFLEKINILGRGLLAKSDIKEGTVLGIYHKLDRPVEQVAKEHDVSIKKLTLDVTHFAMNTYDNSPAYMGIPLPEFIEAAVKLKLAPIYFINHSNEDDEQNVEFYYTKIEQEFYVIFRALKFIPKGAEFITYYGKEYEEHLKKKAENSLDKNDIVAKCPRLFSRRLSVIEKCIFLKLVKEDERHAKNWLSITKKFNDMTKRDRTQDELRKHFYQLKLETYLINTNSKNAIVLNDEQKIFLKTKMQAHMPLFNKVLAFNKKFSTHFDEKTLKDIYYEQIKRNKNKLFSQKQVKLVQKLITKHGKNFQSIWEEYVNHPLGENTARGRLERLIRKINSAAHSVYKLPRASKGLKYSIPEIKELVVLYEKTNGVGFPGSKYTWIAEEFNKNKEKSRHRTAIAIKVALQKHKEEWIRNYSSIKISDGKIVLPKALNKLEYTPSDIANINLLFQKSYKIQGKNAKFEWIAERFNEEKEPSARRSALAIASAFYRHRSTGKISEEKKLGSRLGYAPSDIAEINLLFQKSDEVPRDESKFMWIAQRYNEKRDENEHRTPPGIAAAFFRYRDMDVGKALTSQTIKRKSTINLFESNIHNNSEGSDDDLSDFAKSNKKIKKEEDASEQLFQLLRK